MAVSETVALPLPVTAAVSEPGEVELTGDLRVPDAPRGVVLFAHGSGSSRFSPRNRAVAESLGRYGLATLLVDLLTESEEREDVATGRYRFDIGLLGERVVGAVDWLSLYPATQPLGVHLFGASTGAAAALTGAAERAERVRSVVSRGGRPDLAGAALERVRAPVLLLVGGRDGQVLGLNRDAAALLHAPHEVRIVEGATHLFEEPGALEEVAEASRDWFLRAGEAPGAEGEGG